MDASVAVAVGNVEVAIRGYRYLGRTVERPSTSLDADQGWRLGHDVAGVRWLVLCSYGLEKLAVQSELPDCVVHVVGAPHDVVRRYRDAMRAAEGIFAPGPKEPAIAIEHDYRMFAAVEDVHPVLRIGRYSGNLAAEAKALRKLTPALDKLVPELAFPNDHLLDPPASWSPFYWGIHPQS